MIYLVTIFNRKDGTFMGSETIADKQEAKEFADMSCVAMWRMNNPVDTFIDKCFVVHKVAQA